MLAAIDAIETDGIDPCAVATIYWRTVANRLAARQPLPAYTPGKHAVLALTGILAAELGPRGVRVNAVAPGYTLSEGLEAKIAGGERDPEAIKATTALRRFVEPRDVAEAALFLCSERAAAITGVRSWRNAPQMRTGRV